MNEKPTSAGLLQKSILLLSILFTIITNGQTVTPWLTKGDMSQLLAQQGTVNFGANSGTNPSTVTVNTGTTYQTIDGFGWCLTEGSAEVISAMAATQQNALLNEFFNPATGLSSSVVRISIAASDLSNSSYSYNETAGDVNMNNFSLAGPDLTYLVPILQKILAINPNIKILATPWSAPRWMKTNNAWIGGSLQTTYYAAYAKYFVKYFQAMQAQGINIWAITPQNEPENPNNEPSMSMNSTEQKNFINTQLGPQMAAAGFGGIKIIAFDHNCDNTAYPIDVLNNSSYVDGAAFHLYSGNISAMSTVRSQTNKNIYFTEQYTGGPGNFSGDFGWHMQNVVLGSANNWAKTVLEWNLAMNPSYGPRTPSGCTTCLGAVTINSSTGYTRNVSYYIIGQISKFVKTGATRVSTTSSNTAVSAASFVNTDGSIVVVAYNSGAASNTIKVVVGSQAFDYAVPAASAVTFKWTNGPAVAVTGVTVSPTTATVAVNSSTQLTETVAPANATNKSVTWTSSNAAVASVSSSGLVTGVAAGTAVITVKTVDGNKTATADITVNVVAVTGVSASPATASIFVATTQQLTATVAPANATNKNVTWTSANNAIATVNSSGLVTAVAPGTVAITVTTADGNKIAVSTITVKNQEPYSGTPVSLPGMVQAENYDKGGQNIAYNDADTSNNGGQYRTSEGVDIATIAGTSGYTIGWTAAGEWLEYTVNVTAGNYTIDATVATPNAGKQLLIKLDGTTLATFNIPNTGSWDTFQTVSVANIAFAGGNNKILRLEILGGDFNVDKIEVKSVTAIPVSAVAVSPTSASLVVGNTTQLTKTITPSNATNQNVSWSSSNTSVATVNASGLVTAVTAGTAVITVSSVDGNKTAASTITVTNPTTGFPGYYNIISQNSGKGLDVADNAASSGARIQQYDITSGGGANQRWKFEDAGSGNYYIKVKSTQMRLATETTSTADGVKVVQKTPGTTNDFKWTITSLGGGYYKIINVNSGKALDVENVSTANGANIQVWTYSNGTNQAWSFVQVESTARPGQAPTTGDDQVASSGTVAIYPNPAKNLVSIRFSSAGDVNIEIYNLAGSLVGSHNCKAIPNGVETIDIAALSAGVYIFKIADTKGVSYKKVIKD